MRRSRPSTPCPDGGPKRRGCLYLCRFALLLLVLIWAGVWLAMPNARPLKKVQAGLGFTVFAVVFLCVPLVGFADRLEIRRYCKARGLRVLEIKQGSNVTGVVYMDGDQKRYGRWPDDFKPGTDELT